MIQPWLLLINEVRLTVCFVKPQGWPMLYCIVWTELICYVLASLELFGSFRFWAWLMKSWHYCSMLGEMILAMWYSQGTWLEGKEVIWGHQRTCVFSGLYGVKRREGCQSSFVLAGDVLASKRLRLTRESKYNVLGWNRINIQRTH